MVEINREGNSVDKICFTLRLRNINKEQSLIIKAFLDDVFKVEICNPNKHNDDYLLIIEELDNYSTDDYLRIYKSIKKFDIKKENINIIISMTTEYDMSGFTVPKKISDLFLRIGGSLDFSIIVI
jgi:hypothetical protein